MIAQIIKNRFDNQLKEYQICPQKLVESPLNMSKDNAPLLQFLSILPAKNPVRNQENYSESFAIILDFDGAVSISEFEEKYAKYSFYLYTTASHTKFNNRFRVIIPLKFPVSYKVFSDKLFLECLEIFFPGIDKSCFKNFHVFPILPTDKTQEYYYKINIGEKFSFELLSTNYKRLERKKKSMELLRKMQKDYSKEINSSNIMSEQGRRNYKNKVCVELFRELNAIPRFKTGDRYNKLCSITGKFVNAKYPDESFIFEDREVLDTIREHTNDKAVEKMVHSFLTRRNL